MLNHLVKKTFQQKLDNWIESRLVLQEGTLALHRRSIYIIPTKFGFLFGLVLIAMLIGSINYEISLGFLLTFLFSGIFFIGMLQCYKNFNTIILQPLATKPIFAGEKAIVNFLSLSPKTAANTGIMIGSSSSHHNFSQNNIISNQLDSYTRGIHKISKVKLFSIYPMGHFYVWSWLKTNIDIIVYPKALPLKKMNEHNKTSKSGDKNSLQKGNDELTGYKYYQEGDPTHRIAWKKTAQTGKLHSKEMTRLVSNDYYIDWQQFPNIDTEKRLSHMCYLILQAHNNNEQYGLILPNIEVRPEHNEEHKHKCLKELALFNQHNE